MELPVLEASTARANQVVRPLFVPKRFAARTKMLCNRMYTLSDYFVIL